MSRAPSMRDLIDREAGLEPGESRRKNRNARLRQEELLVRIAEALERIEDSFVQAGKAQEDTSEVFKHMFAQDGFFTPEEVLDPEELGKINDPKREKATFLDYRGNAMGDGFDITHDGENWEPANFLQTQDIRDKVNSRPRGVRKGGTRKRH